MTVKPVRASVNISQEVPQSLKKSVSRQ